MFFFSVLGFGGKGQPMYLHCLSGPRQFPPLECLECRIKTPITAPITSDVQAHENNATRNFQVSKQ